MIVTLPASQIAAHVRAALRFASKDETRPHLSCVRFEVRSNEVRFVATDGCRLWIAAARMPIASNREGEAHLSVADAARLASKAIDRKGLPVTLHFAADRTLTISQGATSTTMRTLALGERDTSGKELPRYPSYLQILEPLAPISADRVAPCVNGTYLADAAASFADVCNPEVKREGGSAVRFFAGQGGNSPFTLTAPGSNAVACILPTLATIAYDAASEEATALVQRFRGAPLAPDSDGGAEVPRSERVTVPSRRKRA
jgi:hypothetical protein